MCVFLFTIPVRQAVPMGVELDPSQSMLGQDENQVRLSNCSLSDFTSALVIPKYSNSYE